MPAGWAKFGRTAAVGITLGLAVAAAVEAGSIFLGRNLHVVIPGEAYRCAQLSHDQFVDTIRGHGIRTVVNLRGTSPEQDWYAAESQATFDADISQEDITLSAYRLPSPDELRRLIEVFDHSEYPILFHCRQGVDRTGLTAALALLLYTDTGLDEARRQLSVRYSHFSLGRTTAMQRFFDLYAGWLDGRPHAPGLFRRWATEEYCPGPERGRLEVID
ncbi:MAG TPA: tyrosine-protein phosphatase, partial [Gemmataceae bacterium]|nr:tyrosine-protein phosphatase [Gemmataceae bacterium]